MKSKHEKAAPITWAEALEFIEEYTNQNRKILESPASATHLTSFKFPKEAFNPLIGNPNVESAFFVIGFHKDLKLKNTRLGYTAISMGLDNNNQLLADSLWDSLIAPYWDNGNITTNTNINIDNVKNLIKFYRENHPIPTEFGIQNTLKGHSFKISELKKIVNEPNIKGIEIILAYHKDYSGFNDQLGYTWILVGIDGGGNRMTSDGYVFDFCDPCPKKCPSNIDFPYFE